jgi:hypothetical protein
MRRAMRETAFRLVRADALAFLDDHEQEILAIFREEMDRLDRRTPEENLFIDIRMVPLGEEILRAALGTVRRFLREL